MLQKDLPFEKKELVVTVHNPNNLPTIDYHNLSILQGDLKSLSKENKAKLCKSILTHGFFIPVFLWLSEGVHYILDATQRYHALEELEKQGYSIPDLPYIEIEASSKKDAALKLLQITSRYGTVNEETSFFKDFDIGLEFMEEIEIPELELSFEGLEGDGGGEAVEHTKLTDKFIVPPFSVLDTRQGYWQDRKRAWIALGIKGEEGRGELGTSPGTENTGCGAFGKNYRNKEKERKPKNIDGALGKSFPSIHPYDNYIPHEGSVSVCATSIFDPVLSELAYKWFCTDNGTILDPFAGGSVRGIVAAYLGYQYTGIELRAEQVEANRSQAETIIEDQHSLKWIIDDSYNIDAILQDKQYDFLFSCPPYYDLEVYSDIEGELSVIKTYDAFIAQYHKIIAKCIKKLKDNRFACFVVGNIRDRKGFYRNFVSDTIAGFQNAGMILYNEAILVNVIGSLPIRIHQAFGAYRKLGKSHQNVLVFFKGDPKTIKDNYGEIEIAEIGEEYQ